MGIGLDQQKAPLGRPRRHQTLITTRYSLLGSLLMPARARL